MKFQLWSPSDRSALWSDPFQSFFSHFVDNGADASSPAFLPRVDIRELDGAFELHADLPGLAKEDIAISVNDGVLTLSGERKVVSDNEQHGWLRVERTYGSFKRSWNLPEGSKPEAITANFKDGVLTLSIPKAEKTKPTLVPIQ